MILASFLKPLQVGALSSQSPMSTPALKPTTANDKLSLQPPRSTFVELLDGLARLCLLTVLVAAPWMFGGVYTNIQFGLHVGVLAALAVWLLSAIWQVFTTGLKVKCLPLAVIPLLAALALGQYQLSAGSQVRSADSIQKAIESTISESTDVAERQRLATRSLIHSLQTEQSIAPVATRFEMQRLLIALATFFLAVQLFATPRAQAWLWGVLALNGAALSFFGICQQLSWNGKLFWTFPLTRGGLPFSSFINRNNAAGYLGICLAASLGLMAATISKSFWEDLPSDHPLLRPDHRRKIRRYSFANFFSLLSEVSAFQLGAGLFVILNTTGVVLAMSRGGWVALAVATLITTLWISRFRGPSVLAFVLGVALICGGLIAWAGLGDRIQQRWAQWIQTGSVDDITSDGRWAHWRDAINIVSDFPVTGTGLGTYQFAYLPYQSHTEISHKRFYHADNQFIEWLVEGGVTGAVIVVLGLLMLVVAVGALLARSAFDPVGLAGLFAIISQTVSACFDFGLIVPANMLALAALFGAVAGRAALLLTLKRFRPGIWGLTVPTLIPSLTIPAMGIAVLIFGVGGLREVNAAAQTHAISRSLPKLDSSDALDEESVVRLIGQLKSAISNYPDDPDAHLTLAELLIFQFRLKEFQTAKSEQPGQPPEDLWLQTHPIFLYQQVNAWEKTAQIERIEMVMESPIIQETLVPAYQELIAAQAACPLAPDISQLLAMISFVVDSERRSGEGQLLRTLVLAPMNPTAYFEVGQLAYSAELNDFAFACWRKSLEMSSRYLLEIHQSISTKLTLDEEMELVIPNSGELLLQLVPAYAGKATQASRDQLASRAIQVLATPSAGLPEATRKYYLGKAQMLLGESDEAIREYREALELSPFQIEWRVELTRILLKHKGIMWALREAETCMAIAPEQKRLQAMVRDLQEKLAAEQGKPATIEKARSK